MTDRTHLSKRLIVLLAMISALGPSATQILLPAVPVIRQDFDVSDDIAQLTLSLSMAAIAIGTLTYGPLSDKFGRRPIILFGLFICAAGSLLCAFAGTIELLVIGRFVQAFGAAVGLVLARAIIRDIYGPAESARVIATLVMVMVVIPMFSPAVGGELLVRFGWQTIGTAFALFSLVMLFMAGFSLPETLKEPVPFAGVGSMLRTFGELLSSRVFSGYAFCVAFVSVVFFSFIAAGPEILVSVYGRPANEYGYYFIMMPCGFMAGTWIARHYGLRLHIDRLMLIGMMIAIVGICLAFVLLIAGWRHPLALFAPVSLTVLGNGITLPNAQAAAINEFPKLAGSASGLTGFLQMALSALAAQLVAAVYNGTAYPLMFIMLAASLLSLGSFRIGVGLGNTGLASNSRLRDQASGADSRS
ncbi:MAG: multidrug effflux MFS transporter [Gammaproteobacteria bacterium]|nr:multidrug effflux MFS transporter [Gammaproteobacteria bacterium]